MVLLLGWQKQINKLVCEFYGLTEEEIKSVEGVKRVTGKEKPIAHIYSAVRLLMVSICPSACTQDYLTIELSSCRTHSLWLCINQFSPRLGNFPA